MLLGQPDFKQKKLIEECYLRTHDTLWYFIFSITKNEQDSYDVLQEAYTRLIVRLPHIRTLSKDQMDAYLTQIAKNLSYQLYHARKRTVLTEEFDFAQSANEIELFIENEYAQYANHVLLKTAMDHIPSKYQEIIKMKYFLNFNNKKIAELLDIKEGSVRMLQSRAVQMLRKIIKNRFKI